MSSNWKWRRGPGRGYFHEKNNVEGWGRALTGKKANILKDNGPLGK